MNPPCVNDKPVEEADLNHGDMLELGYTRFQVSVTGVEPPLPEVKCLKCGQLIDVLPDEAPPDLCVPCAACAKARLLPRRRHQEESRNACTAMPTFQTGRTATAVPKNWQESWTTPARSASDLRCGSRQFHRGILDPTKAWGGRNGRGLFGPPFGHRSLTGG